MIRTDFVTKWNIIIDSAENEKSINRFISGTTGRRGTDTSGLVRDQKLVPLNTNGSDN